jgi:catechol 2,3-dioxygenase-like lactoylglutathione lyase family enzyme
LNKTRLKRSTALGGISLVAMGCGIGFLIMAPGPTTHAAPNPPAVRSAATRSSSAAIRSADVDATAEWYIQKLGFRRISDSETVQARVVVLERNSFLLEIDESPPDQLPPGQNLDEETTDAVSTTAAITLVVRNVDAEVARLKQQGVEVVAEPEDALDNRIRVAYVRDNGRRTIELREPLGRGSSTSDADNL